MNRRLPETLGKRGSIEGSCRRTFSEAGDTLIEVLLALVVLSIAAVALIIAFSTSISASAEHRNITNVGDLLTTISQEATSQMQLAAQSGLFSSCSGVSSYVSALDLEADIPSQYVTQYTANLVTPNATSGLYPVEWWNGTSSTAGTAFVSSCGVLGSTQYANQPQLLTVEVTDQTTGRVYYNSFVVTLPQSSEGTAIATTDCTSVALKWITQPGLVSTPADTPMAEFTMELQCSDGAASADDASSVTWALAQVVGAGDQAGATLTGCSGSNVNGFIYVTGCTVSLAGQYYIVPSDSADTTLAAELPSPVTFQTQQSDNFTIGAAGLSLKFKTQPEAGPSGDAFSVSPGVPAVVEVVNASGAVQTTGTWSGSVTLTSSGGTASNPTLVCPGMPVNTWTGTVVSGSDVFNLPSNCTFSGGYRYNSGSQQSEPTSYTLTATATPNTGSAAVEQATSGPFSVSNTGVASQLVFSQQPTGADGNKGANFAVQPQVTVEDSFGNQVTSNTGNNDTIKLTASTSTSLNCSANSVAATKGVATFTGCSDDTYANGVTITAQSTGVTGIPSIQSLPFNLTPAPNLLVFSTQPVAGASGATLLTEPVIDIYYSSTGNASGVLSLVTAESSQIGLTASGGLLTTCSGLAPNAGVVNVQTCAFAGIVGTNYYLTASLGTLTATSNAISPTVPGVATQLVFTTEPVSTLVAGSDFTNGPVVSVEDSGGNVVISSTVTVTISATPTTGSISSGCGSLQVVAGVVNMSDCTFSGVGGTSYTLTASSGALTNGVSTGFLLLTPPAVPAAPTATVVSPTSVSVTWTAPNSGGSPITGYEVNETNVSTSASTSNVCAGSETSTTVGCVVSGLIPGNSYTFTVAAINVIGAGTPSPASNEISLLAPSAPSAPSAIVVSATSATVTWTAPSDVGPAITGYQINDTNTTTSATGTDVCTGSTTSTTVTCTVAGLTTGDSYTFTVAAINIVGTGSFSSPSNIASVVTPNVPAAPTVTVASPTSASVTWTAPSDAGPAITGYQINDTNATTSATGTNVCAGSKTSTTVTCTVTGLTTGDSYTFTVAAINVVGTGTFSPASTALAVNVVPGTPPKPTVIVASGTSATIIWTAPTDAGTAITGYQINDTNTTTLTTGTNVCAGSKTSTSVTCTVTGLTTGDSYTFTVAAINAEGTGAFSPASDSVTLAVPNAPATPTAVVASATSAMITWAAPTDSGPAITGYQINDTNTTTATNGTNVCAGSTTSTAVTCTVAGLTTGDSYTFTVAAINAVGTGAFSPASNGVSLVKPGAPATPTAVVASATSATIAWTAPTDSGPAITGYQINDTNATTAANGTNVCAGSTTSTSTTCTVTGLTAGDNYTFTVAAINIVGTGSFSGASSTLAVNVVPGTPAAPTATGAGATSISITWTAPSDTGTAITGYEVNDTNTTTSGSTPNVCVGSESSAAVSCTISGLIANDTYIFTVAAINAEGTGAFSPESNGVSLVKPGAPATPTAAVASATSATITWTAPSDSGPAITGYQINDTNTTTTTNGTNVCAGSITSTSVTCNVTGLTTGDSYTFTVAAINIVGTGSFSGASSTLAVNVVPGTPAAPTATVAGSTSASITWIAPSDSGTAITGYQINDVNATTNATGTNVCAGSTASTSVTCTVTGLTKGDSYTFTVAALNAKGSGGFSPGSNTLSVNVVPGTPAAPSATDVSATSVAVAWVASSDSGTAITGYQINDVNATTNATSTNVCAGSGTSTSVTCTVTGLTTSDNYTFTVAAINAEGTGAFSPASTVVTVNSLPGTPAAPTGTVVSATLITVAWVTPSDAGTAITGYQINDTNTTTSATGTNVCAGSKTSITVTCTVTGLTTNDSYTFTVAAINADGTGAFSPASAAVALAKPGTPTAPAATVASATSATITWTAPNDTGPAISGYQINDTNTTTSANGANVCAGSTTSTSVTCTVTGLTTNDSYTFTVAAINAVGTGTFSGASGAASLVTPGAPTIKSATGSGGNHGTTITVDWNAASDSGPAISSYQINETNVSTSANTPNVCTVSGTTLTCAVTGLNHNDEYTFTVIAINAVGTGPASSPSAETNP